MFESKQSAFKQSKRVSMKQPYVTHEQCSSPSRVHSNSTNLVSRRVTEDQILVQWRFVINVKGGEKDWLPSMAKGEIDEYGCH